MGDSYSIFRRSLQGLLYQTVDYIHTGLLEPCSCWMLYL